MDAIIILFRLCLTFLLSLGFGIERKSAYKPVGFGTFIFVAVGSCGFAIIALTMDNTFSLLGSVVTGIGFLGAGALIRTPDKAFGFTTAASIWIFAIFGITIGLGEYILGIIIYFFTFSVILLDRNIDKIIKNSHRKKITIGTNKIVEKEELNKIFGRRRHILISMDMDKKANKLSATYIVYGKKEYIEEIHNELYKRDWLESIKAE